MSKLAAVVLVVALLLAPSLILAQGDETPTSTVTPTPGTSIPGETLTPTPDATATAEAASDTNIVRTVGSDGKSLYGDFYLLDVAQPTVLLLHQLYTDRSSWAVLIGPLLASGRNVLAVDLRGHGATKGAIDWQMAVEDVQAWLDWLRFEAGVRANAISMIGSSMGSSLALVGCANDWGCPTAIAISPGWSYYGVYVEQSFTEKFDTRPVLLVLTESDHWPSLGVPRMVEAAKNPVTVETYEGNAHGMSLFDVYGTELTPLILEWLATYGG